MGLGSHPFQSVLPLYLGDEYQILEPGNELSLKGGGFGVGQGRQANSKLAGDAHPVGVALL